MSEITNELIMCSQTFNDTKDFRRFGNTIINKCQINKSFLQKDNYPIYFYQLYLKENDEKGFKEIPVTIDNYDANNNGRIDFTKDLKQRTFFKRFFIVFNDLNENSEEILYARNITFNIELLNKEQGKSKMKFPYLRIYYSYSSGNEENLDFFFVSNCTMDLSRIMRISLGFLIFCVCLVVLVVAARMYVWTILNPYEATNDKGVYTAYFGVHLIFTIFKYYGIIIFFYSWALTGYWYIFYKLQYRPFVFLPSLYASYWDYNYKFFFVWGLAANMYGFYIMYRIYNQVNCDVFFIDWEHEKDILENVMGKTTKKSYKSPWRTIHIANQYNLLQKSRTISIPFCFCWLILLYYSKYFHWNRYAHQTPNISWVEKSPENIYLRHFVGSFILFIAGICQYTFRRILVSYWVPTQKTEFLDLCSVANVSVLILQDSLRGYYVHGQSPLGVADTTLHQLIQFLEEEGKGKIKGRGLTDEKGDDLQTYEMYLSYAMRKIYDGLYFLPTLQEIDSGNQKDQIQNQAKYRNIFKYIPASLRSANIYQINKYMNNHLKSKIEQVTMQSKILIKDKTLFERFFEFPPSIDLTSKDVKELVFYKDKGENFDDVLFIGMELEWLIFVVYLWEMWVIALESYGGSMAISIFMSYLMEQMFYKVRVFFGEKNLARKAVVDNRFL